MGENEANKQEPPHNSQVSLSPCVMHIHAIYEAQQHGKWPENLGSG